MEFRVENVLKAQLQGRQDMKQECLAVLNEHYQKALARTQDPRSGYVESQCQASVCSALADIMTDMQAL